MPDYAALQKKAKDDIEVALKVWSNLLQDEMQSKIKTAYAKGSAVKNWESPIDYVPLVSDLDIHIKTISGTFEEGRDFKKAMEISRLYESSFLDKRPNHMHIPRSQIVLLNKLEQMDLYTPPRKKDVRMLFGEFMKHHTTSIHTIRKTDRVNLLNEKTFVDNLPMMVIDRTGIDFWNVIRRMNWRVSPAPVRVLTQTNDNPVDLWSWNRSRIVKELEEHEQHDIAESYMDFYMSSWNLFLSNFSDLQAFRDVVRSGYYVLKMCIHELE